MRLRQTLTYRGLIVRRTLDEYQSSRPRIRLLVGSGYIHNCECRRGNTVTASNTQTSGKQLTREGGHSKSLSPLVPKLPKQFHGGGAVPGIVVIGECKKFSDALAQYEMPQHVCPIPQVISPIDNCFVPSRCLFFYGLAVSK